MLIRNLIAESNIKKRFRNKFGIKKRQATYIAPLQPPALATFLSWGVSAGAGRVRPAGANVVKLRGLKKRN